MHGVAEQFSPEGGVDPLGGQLAFSVKTAAKVIDVTERQMWNLVGGDDPEIESFKIRGSRRIHRSALEKYLADRQAESRKPAA